MADRKFKERKLMALMVNDLGIVDITEPEMVQMDQEVHSLPEEELDRTLASRLEIPYPPNEETLDFALSRVEEPERPSAGESGGFTGAPDMSHDPRPEEREGKQ